MSSFRKVVKACNLSVSGAFSKYGLGILNTTSQSGKPREHFDEQQRMTNEK